MTPNDSRWRHPIDEAFARNQWAQAIAALTPVLQDQLTNVEAWTLLAQALESQGQPDAAWRCYERAWILNPLAPWIPTVVQRLTANPKGEPDPAWLTELLRVPPVRVVGAILARDEADTIERCITALRPAVDAVLVVDTGSTDDTVAIAEAAGAQVIQTTWQDDFGKARRAADDVLGHTGWVLWVDADEFLDTEDLAVPRLAAGLFDAIDPPIVFRIGQWNHIGESLSPNYDRMRFYPLGRGFTWQGRLHEQIVRLSQRAYQLGWIRLRVHHWGYDPEIIARRDKTARNIRILRKWADDEPDNPALWSFLGRDLLSSEQWPEAIDALSRAEQLVLEGRARYDRLAETQSWLCEALVKSRRLDEAHQVALRVTTMSPDYPTGWYWRSHTALLLADRFVQQAYRGTHQAQVLAPQYRGLVSVIPTVVDLYAPISEADAWRMAGHWDNALKIYERIAQRYPDQESVHRQIASLRERTRAAQEALSPPLVAQTPS